MKKTKLLTPIIGVAAIGAMASPIVTLASCGKQEQGNVDVKLIAEVKGITIDKQKATKGENFSATISSASKPLVDIKSIKCNNSEIAIKNYDFTLDDSRMSGILTVKGECIIGDDLTVTVITDRDGEYHLSITDNIDNAGLYILDEWFDKRPNPGEELQLRFASYYGVRCNMGDPGEYYKLLINGKEFTGAYRVEEYDSPEGGTYILRIPADSVGSINGNLKLTITRFTYIIPQTIDGKAWVLNLKAEEDLESIIASRGADLFLEVDWDESPIAYTGFEVYANGVKLNDDDWSFTKATDEERTKWPTYEGYIKIHGDCVLDPISVKILY